MQGLNYLSEIEKLKLFKNIRIGMSSEEEFEAFLTSVGNDENKNEIKRRINGLFLEDEFALLCFFMEVCTSLTSLGQSPVNNTGIKVPDYLASFNMPKGKELKCFIEVKTSNALETKKISGSFLNKYSEFCHRFRHPLFIASRIHQNNLLFWILQSESEFINSGRKVDVSNITNNSGCILLDDWFISSINALTVTIHFSEHPLVSQARYEDKGYLHQITVSQKHEGNIFEFNLNEKEFVLNAFLDEFQSNDTYHKEKNILVREIPEHSSNLISSLLLKMNMRVIDSESPDDRLNASRMLAKIESGYSTYINKSYLKKIIDSLNKKSIVSGADIIFAPMGLGSSHDRKKKLGELLKISR
ncbi:hypothetical protein [Citrobacter amalonaticus]|uniref:hypothetical protein n=1 Tax=Citrobacter amalonaticus TaxID=35703 RepID=UPI002255A2D5|nr:hypothetical protein [Citrobacter amalonaticus]MCX3396646.1 hypothetical protein [Citrobacter amalonaticus]MDQ2176084.1 hypothetical protein [Citrobacter amalonaticus]HEJ8533878.1 hypothetical protein [Klebsiella oxytoca]HEJ8589115.1 hypothetical protein [Klebsiella oxytoca]